MTARILDTAPPELIELYKHAEDLGAHLIEECVRMESTAMLGRLISDPRMKVIWKDLLELSCKKSRSTNYGMAIFAAAQKALVLINRPRLSSSEEDRHFSEISDLAGELSRRVDEFGLFGPCEVEEFMTDDELHELATLTHTPTETPTEELEPGSIIQGERFILMRAMTWRIIPTLPELLRRFHLASKSRAPSRLWKQPRAESAGINRFALCISEHVHEQYGVFWDERVGVFTTVALDLATDKEIDGLRIQQLRRTRSPFR